MKIIKEDLNNLERVKDRETTQGIMMKDAEQQSEMSEDNFDSVHGDLMELKIKEPFLGAEKQEIPEKAIVPDAELKEGLVDEHKSPEFLYQMLDRMRTDCDYVIRQGKGAQKYLWAGSVAEQISEMKSIYNYLVDNYGQIDWITMSDIEDYEQKLNAVMSESLNEEIFIDDIKGHLYNIVGAEIDSALDNIAMICQKEYREYNPEWCAEESSEEVNLAKSNLTKLITQQLVANCPVRESLNEAGGMKDGKLMSTENIPLTFWDKIYAELDGNLNNDNDYKKLIELPVPVKDKYKELGVTSDGDIKVYASTKEGLKHAIDVAKHYGLKYFAGMSAGQDNPAYDFYCIVKIPEEKQQEYVTYDVTKQ